MTSYRYLKTLPKAHLHIHLEGAMRPTTLTQLCDKYNILLALDEVQTGYGRTGENFAHQLYDIKPDLMGCGKAAGGGILPISFVAGRDDIIQTLTPGSEGSTFGGSIRSGNFSFVLILRFRSWSSVFFNLR